MAESADEEGAVRMSGYDDVVGLDSDIPVLIVMDREGSGRDSDVRIVLRSLDRLVLSVDCLRSLREDVWDSNLVDFQKLHEIRETVERELVGLRMADN